MKRMMNNSIVILLLFVFACDQTDSTESLVEMTIENDRQPTFLTNEDPVPSGKKWVLVENLSDEFDGDDLDAQKWTADPAYIWTLPNGNTQNRGWYGSSRSLFEKDNASIINDELRIEAKMFQEKKYSPSDNRANPPRRQYGGAIVRSKALVEPGSYMEAEIQSSTTVMSTAFWLSTPSIPCKELTYQEVQELDILECIGKIAGNLDDDWTKDDWAIRSKWDRIYHSNTFRHQTQGCYTGENDKKPRSCNAARFQFKCIPCIRLLLA